MFRRRLAVLVVSSLTAAGTLAASSPSPAGAAPTQRWTQRIAGAWFAWSSPSIADVNGDGSKDVVVGGQDGKVYAFDAHGTSLPRRPPNAPALGDVDGDGINDIVFGAFNQSIYVINGNCAEKARFNNTDSVWSAPALYDIDHDGAQEIFIGGDATASTVGLAHSGGYFRSLAVQNGQLVQRWVRLSDETFQNAGAIGDIDGD